MVQGYFRSTFLPLFISRVIVLEGRYTSCFGCLDQNATSKPNYDFSFHVKHFISRTPVCGTPLYRLLNKIAHRKPRLWNPNKKNLLSYLKLFCEKGLTLKPDIIKVFSIIVFFFNSKQKTLPWHTPFYNVWISSSLCFWSNATDERLLLEMYYSISKFTILVNLYIETTGPKPLLQDQKCLMLFTAQLLNTCGMNFTANYFSEISSNTLILNH